MVKIQSLRLENCQSWEDETIPFGPGLNAIIANNNVGKSVVFKILKVTCNPDFFAKPERAKLVRYGKDFAKATYTFTDGSVATVVITDKKVMYTFTDSDGSVAYSEDTPLNQILRRLSVIVEENSKYLVNVLDSEQSLLLVKSDKKANSDLLKVITEHKGIERLTALFKEKSFQYNSVAAEVFNKQGKVKYKLDNLEVKDVATLKDQVDTLEILYDALDILSGLEFELGRMEESLEKISPVEWEYFIKLLGKVNYMEYSDYVGWGELLGLMQNLPQEALSVPELDISWSSFETQLNQLPTQKLTAPDLDISWSEVSDLLQHLPTQKLSVPELDVDWSLVKGLLNQRQDLDLNEVPDLHEFKTLVQMQDTCKSLTTLLNQSERVQKEIEALKSIDFNGTVYDCPIHGKVVYNNGKCEVSDVREHMGFSIK